MKYQPPYGFENDPTAHYINGDPSIGRAGSIPPAASIEYPMREIVAAIHYAGLSPSDFDLTQAVKAVRCGRLNYMLTMAHLNPGDTVQIGVQNNDPDVVLNRFVFNAIRLGKAS